MNLIEYYNNQPIKDASFFDLESTKQFMLKLVRDRITELGMDIEALDADLIKYKSVISGSFIVQCMIGTFWKGSDMDLFGEITQDMILKDRSEIIPPTIQNNIFCPIHKMELFGWKHHNESPESLKEGKKDVNFMPNGLGNPNNKYNGIIGYGYSRKYKFTLKDTPVIYNFIGTRFDPIEYVMTCFDLSIVRNYYDGKNVVIKYPLHIVLMRAHLLRFTDSMRFLYDVPSRVMERIRRYEARGFAIKRHRKYNCLLEMCKFRNYTYEISHTMDRNKKLYYILGYDYTDDIERLECTNINRIKIETPEYIYKMIRYNKLPNPEVVMLMMIHKPDPEARNVINAPIVGLKNIIRMFWLRERMNKGIKVEFNYCTVDPNQKPGEEPRNKKMKVFNSDYSMIINNKKKYDL